MTDDLRTRAREAAERRYSKVDQAQFRLAFIAGFLAHAAQQPTVDEVAQAIRAADGDHTMGAGQLAEVVLALLNGAGS